MRHDLAFFPHTSHLSEVDVRATYAALYLRNPDDTGPRLGHARGQSSPITMIVPTGAPSSPGQMTM